jgi:hypothetical protein
MSVHKHTSWGRTRSPKNLAGSHGTAITVLANTNTLRGITATTVGYNTENQRYLHVLVEETNDGSDTNADAVFIYGYCHAFQRWFEIPETETGGQGQNARNAPSEIDPTNSSTSPALHVPGSRDYRVYEIHGIDKVAFVAGNASRINVFAACSTF